MVVVIVGVSAAMVAPAMMRTMGISRANRCLYDAARMFRTARSNAIGTGRAHLVTFGNTPGDAQVNVYVGDSSSCARSQWAAITTADPTDRVWEANYTTGGHGVGFALRPAAGGGVAPDQVCFEPQGDRYQRTGGAGAWTRGNGTLVFSIDRLENGASAGDPLRQIVLPQFGTPRVVR